MTSILGISAFYHDSAAALIVDGKIISLPARLDYEKKMKDLFFVHYYERVKEIIKDEYVNFVDISMHPNFINDGKNIFCDITHKTYKGNLITAEILSKYLTN